LDIIDEMKPIRYIEHNGSKLITPFIGRQVDICEAFGFEVPQGCAPLTYTFEKNLIRKRGRPPKKRRLRINSTNK
jgi:hypothetical protein